MNSLNSTIRLYSLIILLVFLSDYEGYAQTLVNGWDEVNTIYQDIPSVVNRMPDGTVLLTAIQFDSYYSQRKLLVVEMDENGKPIKTTNIGFKDTGIVFTEGVFQRSDGGYLIFAAFSVDSPYLNAKKFGYLELNNLLQLTKMRLLDIPFHPEAIMVQRDPMKFDSLKYEYYGLQTLVYTPGMPCYSHLLILDSLLQVQVSFPDSHAMILIDTTSFAKENFGGSVTRLNDSLYSMVYVDLGIEGSAFRQYNRNQNRSKVVWGGLLLDSVPYLHHVYFSLPQITYQKLSDTTVLLAGPVKQYIYPETAADTLLEHNMEIGQSIIAEVNTKTYDVKKFHLLENWRFDFTSCTKDAYYSAITKNFDFIYPNYQYYLCFCGFYNIESDLGGYEIKLTQLNKDFKTSWMLKMNLYTFESPYSVIATADSGCLMFTRRATRFYNEPLLGRTDFPEYDIGVYKINTKGEYTSVQTIKGNEVSKVSVYPNPAQHAITFHNLPLATGYTVKIWDITSKSYGDITLNPDATIKIDFLKPGLYVYHIQSTTGEKEFKGKFLVE